MDEEMYDECEVTPSKKKKKSKKRKHEESVRYEQPNGEEQQSEEQSDYQQNEDQNGEHSFEKPKSKSKKKSKSSKRDREESRRRSAEKSYEEPANEKSYEERVDEESDDLFQAESIQLDETDRLDEEASYDFFGQQEEEEKPVEEKPVEEEATSRATTQKSYHCEPFSCVEMMHRRLKFPLLPTAIGHELQVITSTLVHKWKYNFINELNGFLYYFQNVKLVQGTYGRIMDDLPYIYCDITADFYVFKPKVGEYLKATISCFEDSNKVINCSTGCGLTISIELPEEISEELNAYLKLEQEIIFLIRSIDYGRMLIEGTFNKRAIKLMKEHVEIRPAADDPEREVDQESNLDDFFAN